MIDKTNIRNAIKDLDIQGNCICVHSSLKSFGCHIEEGAETVISSFLDEACTVMVPSFDDDCEIYPPKHFRPKRNGTDDYLYFENKEYGTPKIFSVESNDITKDDMGIIPYTLVNMPMRKRGYHPLASMSAIGYHASELVGKQTAMDVWSPFKRLCELNGFILLMGVQLCQATIIHYAEQLAGRTPFVRWANNQEGVPSFCHTGGCSDGFENFANVLRPIEKSISIGSSIWRCFPAKEMVDLCVQAIQENPNITHCHNPNCERCNDAVLGGPIWEVSL